MYNDQYSVFNSGNPLATLNVSSLPIAKHKSQIIDTVRNNQVTIIYGDTGSGKTTQIPQYLLDAGVNNGDIIAVTQPRRIAAIAMARRVAEERRWGLGIEVGYEVRFDSKFVASTKIRYLTDGMMLNHCLSDPKLSEYSIIMIDEAHERSIHSDVLLGLLRKIMVRRKELKILITSATIRTERFSNFFNGAPIVSFDGRLFPIEIVYQESSLYIHSAVEIVKKIHSGTEKGDVLIFLTGEDEIDECCRDLMGTENLVVLPLCGSMDCDTQRRVFARVEDDQRKVVVATNIAETTITIDGIKFVIDCGYVKQNTFNANIGMEVLGKTRISKAQADQRKGRAGRTCNGRCYRLYSEFTYNQMLEEAIPEILRINLCEMYLKIVAIGLDPMNFDFIDAPKIEQLELAKKELQELDLLGADDSLTDTGKQMQDLPVEPILGKVLLSSAEFHCTNDIITILSMMTEKNVFKHSKKKYSCREAVHKSFAQPYGDHLTQLTVFNQFIINEKSKSWCFDNFLNYDTLMRVDHVRNQLIGILLKKGIPIESSTGKTQRESIRKAIVKGYYRNICAVHSKGVYRRYFDMETLYLHPGSCLFDESPKIILYHEVVHTMRRFMRGIMKLDDQLLSDFPSEMKKIRYTPGSAISKVWTIFRN